MARAGLSTLRVVEEAETVADEIGLPSVTLMLLATRLGVKMPSLYKHVDGIGALHRLVGLRARIDLADALRRAAVGKAGADAVQAISMAYRDWVRQHPGRYAATLRSPDPQDLEDVTASRAIVEVASDAVSGYGLTGDDQVDAIRALRATLHGFVSLEQAGAFWLPTDVDRSFDRLINALAQALAGWASTPTQP